MIFLAFGVLFSLFYLFDVAYDKLQKKAEIIFATLPLAMFIVLFIVVLFSSLTENISNIDNKERVKANNERVVRKNKTK